MNLAQFFEHWQIVENPFRGEEARHDSVFARLTWGAVRNGAGTVPIARTAASGQRGPAGNGGSAAQGTPMVIGEDLSPREGEPRPRHNGDRAAVPHITVHSDFEKILGDLRRPSTAIVFGEKGSGKTAIRLQIAERINAHNRDHPDGKVLLVPYDDLNGVLDRFHRRVQGRTPLESFQKFRLVDHIDAILGLVVPRLVDSILARPAGNGRGKGKSAPVPVPTATETVEGLDLGPEPRKVARRLDQAAKRDLLLLQAIYDRPDNADLRTSRLRSTLRLGPPGGLVLWTGLAWFGWIPAAAVLIWALTRPAATVDVGAAAQEAGGSLGLGLAIEVVFFILLALWLGLVAKRYGWDALMMRSLALRVRRQVRVQARTDASYARSLRQLDPVVHDADHLPLTESDEARYAMLDRMRRTLREFGYSGITVVLDRVDEPTLVSGDPERMKAVVWPLLNNKFLQQEGLGVKMLLPIELRHALFKESSAFFQEARLDKQNLVERLTWTGAMLYDLCDARLKACRAPGGGPISLLDLFAEDVSARDLVDALDQMHQPRDAFKFLYACLSEHCSNVTAEQEQWQVPRLVLEGVRKQQSDRVQQLYRGIRPA
jgi:hypothetical protein